MVKRHPEIVSVHPTMIHVVRKSKGKQRLLHKEPVPNAKHCSQEFILVGDTLKIRNQTGPEDINRPEQIAEEDEMFRVKGDRIIGLGGDAEK